MTDYTSSHPEKASTGAYSSSITSHSSHPSQSPAGEKYSPTPSADLDSAPTQTDRISMAPSFVFKPALGKLDPILNDSRAQMIGRATRTLAEQFRKTHAIWNDTCNSAERIAAAYENECRTVATESYAAHKESQVDKSHKLSKFSKLRRIFGDSSKRVGDLGATEGPLCPRVIRQGVEEVFSLAASECGPKRKESVSAQINRSGMWEQK